MIELEDLIYQVNLIPPDFQMQSLEFLTERGLTKAEAVKDCLKYTPLDFQKHIEFMSGYNKVHEETAQPTRNFYLNKMADAYFEYYEMRYSMLMLVHRLEMERANPDAFFYWSGIPIVIRALVVRDATGKLQEIGLASLIGKFDDSRLRSCKICKCIFWAKKKNSETCGDKKCADALGNKKRLEEAKALKEKHNNHFQSRLKNNEFV